MSTDFEVIDAPPPPERGKRETRVAVAALTVVALLVIARVALHFGAEITVKSAFYDGIGMGDVYARRWHTSVILGAVGVGLGILLALPALLAWRVPKERGPADGVSDAIERWLVQTLDGGHFAGFARVARRRWLPLAGVALLLLALCTSMAGRFIGMRDDLLSWRNAAPFGDRDPVFGKDIGFFVFDQPAWTGITRALATGLGLATVAVLVSGALRWFTLMTAGRPRSAGRVAERARSLSLLLAGLFLMSLGGLYWLARYSLVIGGDSLVAGAGRATRDIGIPTQTVAALAIMALGLILVAAATPPGKRALRTLESASVALAVAVTWVVVSILLVVFASPWWLVLLVVALAVLAGVLTARRKGILPRARAPLAGLVVSAAASSIVLSLLGPIGTALNDAIVLRGSRLQVERANIDATLQSTRRATGLDRAEVVEAPYRRAAVTRAAIAKAPASVASLRFLDIPPTAEACSRQQTFNQFYTCDDVDVDRYAFGDRRRTVFAIGREIDYSRVTDFQRLHFTFTSGYGLVLAPVNEVTGTGSPRWIAGNIPQDGLNFEGDNGSIYFGAVRRMPWSMVNTSQPVFAPGGKNAVVRWNGGTGVRVGSGWRRLAITEYLGGLPFVGGGRRIWNATSGRPASGTSDLLLYRDLTARLNEIAPFMGVDGDPYFVAASGRLYVMAPVYATTTNYPYASSFLGVRYLRQSTMAVMDAYSGETKLYVLDEKEPITRAWRAVYPKLFTSGSELPPALREHVRFGEAGLNVLAAAAQRFHVTSTDAFYNGDDAWAPTSEAYGAGVQGDRIQSPIRYTYAVLPGATQERFVAIQSYKPALQGRGIGFSGWLAVVNDTEQYGRTVLVRFRTNQREPLDSLDTFTSNVSRDPELSAEIGVRRDQTLRGNTIVVPVGEGLLYVQPLYLDSPGDSLPTLWRVIVSFGDGQVFAGSSFEEALGLALEATDSGGGDGGGEAPKPGTPGAKTLPELVRAASEEFAAYQRAFGRGDDTEALRRLQRFRKALAAARALADRPSAP